MEEKIFNINFKGLNLKISVNIEINSDKWIFCLHGIQTNKNIFNELLENSFFKNYSKLAIDLIGFGNSSKAKEFSYDINDQKEICLILLQLLNIKKVHLIGHSLGGMVAILLADEFKGEILSLINMEGNLTFDDCGKSREVTQFSYEKFNSFFYEDLKKEIKNSKELNANFRKKSIEQIPSFVFYKTSISIVKWSKKEILLKKFNYLKYKKLFVYGEKNFKKTSYLNKTIQTEKVSDSGHFMILDKPKETFQIIKNFIS